MTMAKMKMMMHLKLLFAFSVFLSPALAFINLDHSRHVILTTSTTTSDNRYRVLSSSSASSILPPAPASFNKPTIRESLVTVVVAPTVTAKPPSQSVVASDDTVKPDNHWTRSERRLEALALEAQAVTDRYAEEIAKLRSASSSGTTEVRSKSTTTSIATDAIDGLANVLESMKNALTTATTRAPKPEPTRTTVAVTASPAASATILSPELYTVKTNLIWTSFALLAGVLVVQPTDAILSNLLALGFNAQTSNGLDLLVSKMQDMIL